MAACIGPTTTTDLWTHLRVGEDVLAEGVFPSVERYSATAEGRPFIAHEWLSAVVLAIIHSALGGPGLTLLRGGAVGAALALLLFAAPVAQRRNLAFAVLLILAACLISFRAHVRPHLFTLLILCGLTFLLERWRRNRSFAELAWVVPIHFLWVNLHGAYLFGIGLLGVLTICVGACAAVPALQPRDETTYRASDSAQLGILTLASGLACLLNPYGVHIFEFSLRMSEGSEYMRFSIWEWRSTLQIGPGKPWFPAYCAMGILVWSSILLRLRARPVLDFAVGSVVTYLSLRANRFVPYLAIFGLPIAARAWCALEEKLDLDSRPRFRWAASGLVVLYLIATSAGPGAVYGARLRRQIGWGTGGDMPYESVSFLENSTHRGVIYNDYNDGALIIYRLYPRIRPVMDSRMDIYGEKLVREYGRSRRDLDAFYAYLDKYGVSLALLANTKAYRSLIESLEANREWRRVFQSQRRTLFARR